MTGAVRRRALTVAVVTLAVTALVAREDTAAPQAGGTGTPPSVGRLSLGPAADATVERGRAGLGRAATLRVAGPRRSRAYLRFPPSPPGADIVRAVLRLHVVDPARTRLELRAAGNAAWPEERLSPRTAPRAGAKIAKPVAVRGRGRVEVDVTDSVVGRRRAAFALTGRGRHAVGIASREAPRRTLRPRLLLTLNRAPRCQDAVWTVGEDTRIADRLSCTDPDGDPLSFRVVKPPSEGVLEVDAAGTGVYRPEADASGRDAFTFSAGDGRRESLPATVQIAVGPVNDAPHAGSDEVAVDEDSVLALAEGDLIADDTPGPPDEAGQRLRVVGAEGGPEAHGRVEHRDGLVRYVPDPDFNGTARLTYTITDDVPGDAKTATGVITVAVRSVNDAPVARPDSADVDEDGAVDIDVLANDDAGPADESDALELASAGDPAHGTATVGARGLRYVPEPDFHGTDRVVYRACEAGSGRCAEAPVTVNVRAVNDAPVTRADVATAATGGAVAVDAAANDDAGPLEEGQTLIVEDIAGPPSYGTAELRRSGPDAGRILYRAPTGYHGPDWLDYRVCDDGGPDLQARRCSVETIRLSVAPVTAAAETTPVPNGGEAADDPAIWVDPSDSAASTIIGTDKVGTGVTGGIAVYGLSGAQLEYLAGGRMNNVDLRDGVPVGGATATIVAATDRADPRIAVFRVDPLTRRLVPAAARPLNLDYEPYGLCMYRDPASASTYAFVTSRTGAVEQWELFDDGSGSIDGRRVRSFRLDSIAEGCVADDELGDLYVAEESVGIWKLRADAAAGDDRTLVDAVGSGHLTADVEGLALARRSDGTGHLVASSQGASEFVVYRREARNAFVRTFPIAAGPAIDGAEQSDGIEITTAPLGPYPQGALVAHDADNGDENQNFKLVPLEAALGEGGEPPPPRPATCARPYASSSPWNTPISPDAAPDPDPELRAEALGGPLTSDATQYTYPVYEVSATTPRTEVTLSGWFSNVTNGGATLVNERFKTPGPVSLPLPDEAAPAAGSDAQIILVDPSTGDEWGASRLERDPATGAWSAWNAYHYNTAWSGVPPADENGDPFMLRGAGVPYLTGLVRPCEIARGRIDHALAFAYDFPTAEYIDPATKSDGNAWDGVDDATDSHPGDVPEGARLQLDPSLTREQLESLGCTGPCLTIARALQEYGMYVIDNAGRPKIMLEYEGTARWNGAIDSRTTANIPMQRIRVLEPPAG